MQNTCLILRLKIPSAAHRHLGTELDGSIEQVAQDIGFSNFLIETINKTQTSFIGFLDQSIAKAENADPLETITRLLDDERILNASYPNVRTDSTVELNKLPLG